MKGRKNLIEASWELFLKTGDPFYFMAKNTFDEENDSEQSEDKKIDNGLTNGKNNNNKGNMS